MTRARGRGETSRVRLRRRFPARHVAKLLGYLFVAGTVLVLTSLVFGEEPGVLDNGAANPLSHLTVFMAVALSLGAVPFVYRLVRLPRLEVNHFGLIVRPGALRTMVLPWVHIEQLAGYTVQERRHARTYLLIACDGHQGRLGDRPGYADRIVFREAMHVTGGLVGDFDVAVRMRDFADTPSAQLAQLSAFAPNHVDVVDLSS
ncbi:MAG TPA: hypothetical protein VGF17_08785 [Phytomonospora sp.]